MAGVGAVHRQVDDGSGFMAFHTGNAEAFHQPGVAAGNLLSVHQDPDAVAADLLHMGNPGEVQGPGAGLPNADGDGMGGGGFRQGGVFQQVLIRQGRVVYGGDLENALRQGAGLVEDHDARTAQLLQPHGPFHQDARLARSADAGEKRQGDADNQGAGAGDDQEGQGPVNPFAPLRRKAQEEPPDQGRQEGQRQGAEDHRGSIIPGETGDEGFRPGFQGGGVLHQLQDF